MAFAFDLWQRTKRRHRSCYGFGSSRWNVWGLGRWVSQGRGLVGVRCRFTRRASRCCGTGSLRSRAALRNGPGVYTAALRLSERAMGRLGTCHRSATGRLCACPYGAPRSGACRAAGRSPARESEAPAARNTRAQRACVAVARSATRPTGACGVRDASEASLSRSGAVAPRVKRWGRARVPEPNVVAVGSAGDSQMPLRQRPAHAGARALRRSLARGVGATDSRPRAILPVALRGQAPERLIGRSGNRRAAV